jgi:hypothetical protein
MEHQANGSLRLVITGIALAVSVALGPTAVAQLQQGQPQQQRNEQGTSRAAPRKIGKATCRERGANERETWERAG